MIGLEIELDGLGNRICFRTLHGAFNIRGNGFWLICFLLANDSDEYLSSANVRQLPKWQKMQLSSVGKQVARIIANLKNQNIDIVQWKNKTDGWRLNPKIAKQIDAATKAAATELLLSVRVHSGQTLCQADYKEVADWYIEVTQAMLAMTRGKAQLASDHIAAAYSLTDDPFLSAISDPLFTKIGQSLSHRHHAIPLEIAPNYSLMELAIEARVAAAQAARSDSSEWIGRYDDLERISGRLRNGGDFTSLARVTNGLAILAKRLGKYKIALEYIKEAASLAFFSGDLILMQSVAFNFGNILCENQRKGEEGIENDTYIKLLELEINMRKDIGFGNDRAQAELVLAYIYYQNNDFASAKKYIDIAYVIINRSGLNADLGLYHNVNGLLLLKIAKQTGGEVSEAIKELGIAISQYKLNKNDLALQSLIKERDELLNQ